MIFWQKQMFSEMGLNVVPSFLWLTTGPQILCVGMGMFVAGVKGLRLFLAHQWRPLTLALAITLFPSVGNILYEAWGMGMIGSPPFALYQIGLFVVDELAPYLLLSALFLVLLSDEFNTHRWRVTRSLGVLLAFVLVASLAMIIIWDAVFWVNVVNPPFGYPIGTVESTRGIWPLFGGQWFGPLIANALFLAIALGLALLALIRSFLIRPENEQSGEQLAA